MCDAEAIGKPQQGPELTACSRCVLDRRVRGNAQRSTAAARQGASQQAPLAPDTRAAARDGERALQLRQCLALLSLLGPQALDQVGLDGGLPGGRERGPCA